ncbi:MAG: glycerophosphodiester phosphodiesterase [Clostridia bacterium]|nr:glycerophosphodiester phosphodiesterase [Clostridia bacterium]
MMWIVWVLLALLILLLAYAWAIRPNLPRRDISSLMGVDYAHRGLWNTNEPDEENRPADGLRPENSLAAFRAAVEKGYGIELDVHRTRDGALVVHHDDSLKRLTGTDIRIADSTLKELRACTLPNGEPIPTFDEVLKAVSGRVPLIVELKVENGNQDLLSRAVYDRMKRYNGPWCMESFMPGAVKWFRKNAPEVIRGQLAFDHAGTGKTAFLFWRNIGIASMLQNFASRPDFVAFEAKSVKWHTLSIHLLRLMKPWFVAWTVRSQEDMDKNRRRWDLQIFEKFEAQK